MEEERLREQRISGNAIPAYGKPPRILNRRPRGGNAPWLQFGRPLAL
jgi:hypothetical protein